MSNNPPDTAHPQTPILQFRLWTLFVALAGVAVLAALAKSFGKDGVFIGSIAVPLITGVLLIRGSIGSKFLLSLAVTLIVHGITWCALSPDAKFWRLPYRGDDVLGVSFSLGLILGGVVILALRRRGFVITCLSVLLLWSVLVNVVTVYGITTLRAELIRQMSVGGVKTPTLPGPVKPAQTQQAVVGTLEE
jgi:hypothetical protein